MKFEQNKSLLDHNTFQVNAIANSFLTLENYDDLNFLPEYLNNYNEHFILGGGSNILLMDNYSGLIIHPNFKGISVKENEDDYLISVGAGEDWHEFVSFCANNNYYGLENLALIPGNVGAAPVQNIGAYGVEQNHFFESLKYYHLEKNEIIELKNSDCKFAYRDSIFKNELRSKAIILKVNYKLLKSFKANLDYKELEIKLKDKFNDHYSNKDLFDLVCEIRKSKLPYPDQLPNSGSFFKNPVISKDELESLQTKFPDIRHFPFNDKFKLSAAWLIDQSGLKGYRKGDAGVYDNHALILVNHGSASGNDIYQLSNFIIEKVHEKFNVTLEREVNVIFSTILD